MLRYDEDGSIHEATALLTVETGTASLSDFRDINGQPMPLPGGARFELVLPLDDLGGASRLRAGDGEVDL